MSYEKLDIALLDKGNAQAEINSQLQEAVADCLNPNKDREKVRKVTVEFKVVCSPDGESAAISYEVKQKFPSNQAGQDMLQIRKNDGMAFVSTDVQLGIDFNAETGEVTPSIFKTNGGDR